MMGQNKSQVAVISMITFQNRFLSIILKCGVFRLKEPRIFLALWLLYSCFYLSFTIQPKQVVFWCLISCHICQIHYPMCRSVNLSNSLPVELYRRRILSYWYAIRLLIYPILFNRMLPGIVLLRLCQTEVGLDRIPVLTLVQ